MVIDSHHIDGYIASQREQVTTFRFLMKITAKQISAGMGMAGLSASALADLAGINRGTLGHILRGQTNPDDDTVAAIKNTLEQSGVEFLGNYGVQEVQHQMRTLSGLEGLKTFFGDVRYVAQNTNVDISICGFSEDYFEKKLGDFINFQRQEMASYGTFKMRCLVEESDLALGASSYCQYRWQAKENFSNVPFYIYGDKLAIIVTTAPEDPLILLIQNRVIAEAYRKQFDAMWLLAKEPITKGDTA